jgi:hypothetical protein
MVVAGFGVRYELVTGSEYHCAAVPNICHADHPTSFVPDCKTEPESLLGNLIHAGPGSCPVIISPLVAVPVTVSVWVVELRREWPATVDAVNSNAFSPALTLTNFPACPTNVSGVSAAPRKVNTPPGSVIIVTVPFPLSVTVALGNISL